MKRTRRPPPPWVNVFVTLFCTEYLSVITRPSVPSTVGERSPL